MLGKEQIFQQISSETASASSDKSVKNPEAKQGSNTCFVPKLYQTGQACLQKFMSPQH